MHSSDLPRTTPHDLAGLSAAQRPLRERLRVLVVDDMSTSRGMLAQALDAIGCRRVMVADDGTTALRVLKQHPIDLVLSDYLMPGMGGLALLEHIRANPRFSDTPFILMTGLIEPEVQRRGRKLGVSGYLEKPYSLPILRATIETVVGRL